MLIFRVDKDGERTMSLAFATIFANMKYLIFVYMIFSNCRYSCYGRDHRVGEITVWVISLVILPDMTQMYNMKSWKTGPFRHDLTTEMHEEGGVV